MAISDEISKLQTNLSNAYASCESKGATMPISQNFDNLATTIDSIETGGGGITPTGTISITENGTYDVTNYASAAVSVAGSSSEENKTIPVTKYLRGILYDINVPFTIEQEQFKGAFQQVNTSSFFLAYDTFHTVTGVISVAAKGLQEAFKDNPYVKTVDLLGISHFASDALLDCFVNSKVTRIYLQSDSGYSNTVGFDNKWGAPTATITTIMGGPM